MLTQQFDPLKGEMLQILSPEGKVLRPEFLPEIEKEELKNMYRTMVLSRTTDQKALQYQRQGRMLTYAPNIGQEAASLGAAAALKKEDWLVPAFRELAAWLYRGMTLTQVFLYWAGSEEGSKFDEGVKITPIAVPIASQLNHATGIAMAARIQHKDEVVLGYVGDGGTSHGEFHEALNFAAVFEAPVVFLIQNNQFAISVPRKAQTKSQTLAQKAIAYGMPGIQVDGNDIFAVYGAAKEAIERARKGEGPTLIEALTYRMGPHTTSDDPTIYRTEEEVDEWRKKDPIARFRAYLLDQKYLDEKEDEAILKEAEDKVAQVFGQVEEYKETPLKDIFAYTYGEMTPNLKWQYEDYQSYLEGRK